MQIQARHTRDDSSLDPRRWIALGVVLLATFMGVMDMFIVNVAIPSIQKSLHADFSQVQLVIAGYTLAYSVGLVTGGRLGDVIGRKRMFLIGTAAFTLTSLAAGLSPDASVLIVFRVLQGLAAAVMLPQVTSIIQVSFPPVERNTAFSYFGAVNGLSSIVGQIIGGLLLRGDVLHLGWRAVFMVNIPIGVISLVMAASVLRETEADEQAKNKLDVIGALLLGVAVFLLVNPLAELSSSGWNGISDLQIVFAVVFSALFVAYERRLERQGILALVPFRLFRFGAFRSGLLIRFFFATGISPLFFCLAFYLQVGVALSPLQSGLVFCALAVGFTITSLVAKWMLPKLWGRVLVIGGIGETIGVVCLIAVVASNGGPHIALLVLALLLFGLGEGLVASPINPIALLGIPRADVGAASGVLLTLQAAAGALGVAVIGTVFLDIAKTARATSGAWHVLHAYGQAFAVMLLIMVALNVFMIGLSRRLPRSQAAAESVGENDETVVQRQGHDESMVVGRDQAE
jgi:EmrB/QacA subfamily drug resistance transporter